MKIQELWEAIEGWKHAHSDLQKMRAARSTAQHAAKLVRLKKDGTESRMHDAVIMFPTEQEARDRHSYWVKINPGKHIRHNLYVDDQFVALLDSHTITEISHKVGAAAQKALTKVGPSSDQAEAQKKWKALDAREKEIQSRADAHTGKYARELQNISRQKIKTATSGHLNAFGEPLMEYASSGATGAAHVASVANPFGITMRRPSLFGYTPDTPSKTRKKRKSKPTS